MQKFVAALRGSTDALQSSGPRSDGQFALWTVSVCPVMRATLPIPRPLVSSCPARAIQSGRPTLEFGRPHFPACASGGQDQSLQPRSGHLGTLALNQQGVSELVSAVAANNGKRCKIG